MEYIDALRVFLVAETRSFTHTASLLGVSTAAVSRSVVRLEKRLGVRLLNRTTRHVSLTQVAEHFYAGCATILSQLDDLEAGASLQAHEPEGVIRIVAHASATTHQLVPLISGFKRQHSGIAVDVTFTERQVDMVADGFDVGFLLPYMQMSKMVVTRLLARIPLMIVASPEYLARNSVPAHPRDLTEHTFVAISPSIRKARLKFRVGPDFVEVPVRYEIVSNNAPFNLGVVREGMGIGVLPSALVQGDIAIGKLVPVLDSYVLADVETELSLSYTTRTLLPARTRIFIEYALEYFHRTGWQVGH